MRDPARALTCIITALTVASCIQGEPVDLDRNPWTPPPKQVVDLSSTSVVAGRLWVLPNPILFRPDQHEVFVEIWSIGTEDAIITDIRFAADGNREVSVSEPDDTLSGSYFIHWGGDDPSTRLPINNGSRPDCGGGPGMGFPLFHDWYIEDLTPGILIVETDDPASPRLEVTIDFDMTGTHTTEEPYSMSEDIFIDVRPNPVHFTRGRAELKELCVGVQHPYTGFALDDVRIHGEDLSLVEPVDLSAPGGFSIEYAPTTDEDVNGALIVDFTDNWGDEETLVVPILVR